MTQNFECTPACTYCAAKEWNEEMQAYACNMEGAIFRREHLGSHRRAFVPPSDCPQGYTSGGMDNLTQRGHSDGGRRPATPREIGDAINRAK